MKNAKRILSILLAALLVMMAVPMAVSAAGTQDDPIDAADKWFGYGADTYLLNPTIAEGTTDGIWYTLTAANDGILFLEHSYKNVDYTIYVTVNDMIYEGGCVDGVPYNRPIHTYPVKTGDVATVQIVTKDAAAGTVYANMNVIANDASNAIKVKSVNYPIYVSAGQTVYFQDDFLQAEYATKYAILSGSSMDGVTFYNVINNSTNGTFSATPNTDTDGDNTIEVAMGGSAGSAGAPAVKPAWAVENKSAVDKCFTLTLVDEAHECVYDNEDDIDCNTCGAGRVIPSTCEHEYDSDCDADCNLCGAKRVAPHYPAGDYDCDRVCCVCRADLTTAEHQYSCDIDTACDVCGANREVDMPFEWIGASVSEDVNGLAVRYDLTVEGMAVNGSEAIYTNATFCGYKLVSMGAVVCNNYADVLPTREETDGKHVTDVSAKYLYEFNAEDDTAAFVIRLINIPEAGKDTEVFFNPYVVIENDAGDEVTVYISAWAYSCSYNAALGE